MTYARVSRFSLGHKQMHRVLLSFFVLLAMFFTFSFVLMHLEFVGPSALITQSREAPCLAPEVIEPLKKLAQENKTFLLHIKVEAPKR
jgi:hypothetical protein